LDFPVQQTASLSGACAVVGRSLFLKNRPRRHIFPREANGTLIAYLRTKMNCNQVIRPEIEPTDNGGHGGQPGLAKIRRKLGLTFVLSNPFRVQVAQSPARPDAPEDEAVRKMKKESI
jgi:hypothetical protein